MLLFISLLIHNFPEGLAVAASAMESTKLGVTVAFGIMIHNIPEGIAIAVPCLAARPDQPWMAFLLASGSGLAEPFGAAVALLLLRNQSTFPLENVLAFVAGIMIMVALWELYPEAKRHDTPKYFAAGTLTGIAIMGMTELYLP
jgi:ZIP family zinc transporter